MKRNAGSPAPSLNIESSRRLSMSWNGSSLSASISESTLCPALLLSGAIGAGTTVALTHRIRTLSNTIFPTRSGKEGKSSGAIRVIWAGPGCFTQDPELPAVSVVPDTVLEETNRLRSSFGRPTIDEEANVAVLAAGDKKTVLV